MSILGRDRGIQREQFAVSRNAMAGFLTAMPLDRVTSEFHSDYASMTILRWIASRNALRVLLILLAVCGFAVCQQSSPAPDGQAIFLQRCAKCHGDQGEGISAAITSAGPNLQAEHDRGTVEVRVWVGKGMMPAFGEILTPKEIDAVTDYVTQHIAVIPLGEGELGKGGKLFREHCAPCHRTAVRGGALVFTGVNAPSLVDKSPAIVAGAIRWGPGPMPSFSPQVIDDKDLDSIVKYVEFVQHPPSPGGTPMNWYGPVAEGCIAWIMIFVVVGLTGWIEKGGKG